MQSVSDYVTVQKELLELERVEERKETVASGEGTRLSLLELSGVRYSLHFIDAFNRVTKLTRYLLLLTFLHAS